MQGVVAGTGGQRLGKGHQHSPVGWMRSEDLVWDVTTTGDTTVL